MIVMKNFRRLRQNPELFWRDKVKMVQKSSRQAFMVNFLKECMYLTPSQMTES